MLSPLRSGHEFTLDHRATEEVGISVVRKSVVGDDVADIERESMR
jgi:hypothetical protein